MNLRKHNRFLNHFWFFMAVYFLNISIDYNDIKADYDLKTISFNEQESIIELLIEKALGFENAILENESEESEQDSFKKNFSLDKFILSNPFEIKNNLLLVLEKEKNHHKCDCYKTTLEIHSPPPKKSFL